MVGMFTLPVKGKVWSEYLSIFVYVLCFVQLYFSS